MILKNIVFKTVIIVSVSTSFVWAMPPQRGVDAQQLHARAGSQIALHSKIESGEEEDVLQYIEQLVDKQCDLALEVVGELENYCMMSGAKGSIKLVKRCSRGRTIEQVIYVSTQNFGIGILSAGAGSELTGIVPNNYFVVPFENIFEVNYVLQGALHRAAARGMVRVVKRLIELGLDVNLQDSWGQTPLMRATQGKDLQAAEKIILMLLKKAADPHITDFAGYQAKHHAWKTDLEISIDILNDLTSYASTDLMLNVGETRILPSVQAEQHGDLSKARILRLEEMLCEADVQCCLQQNKWMKQHLKAQKQIGNSPQTFEKKAADRSALVSMIKVINRIAALRPDDFVDAQTIVHGALGFIGRACNGLSKETKGGYQTDLLWPELGYLAVIFPADRCELKASRLLSTVLPAWSREEGDLWYLQDRFKIMVREYNNWESKNAAACSDVQPVSPNSILRLHQFIRYYCDLGSLDVIIELSRVAAGLNMNEESNRKSLLTIIKKIGDTSKYEVLGANLSPVIKGMIPEMSWNSLQKLRNILKEANQKNPEVRGLLNLLIKKGKVNNLDLATLRSDVVLFGERLEAVRNAITFDDTEVDLEKHFEVLKQAFQKLNLEDEILRNSLQDVIGAIKSVGSDVHSPRERLDVARKTIESSGNNKILMEPLEALISAIEKRDKMNDFAWSKIQQIYRGAQAFEDKPALLCFQNESVKKLISLIDSANKKSINDDTFIAEETLFIETKKKQQDGIKNNAKLAADKKASLSIELGQKISDSQNKIEARTKETEKKFKGFKELLRKKSSLSNKDVETICMHLEEKEKAEFRQIYYSGFRYKAFEVFSVDLDIGVKEDWISKPEIKGQNLRRAINAWNYLLKILIPNEREREKLKESIEVDRHILDQESDDKNFLNCMKLYRDDLVYKTAVDTAIIEFKICMNRAGSLPDMTLRNVLEHQDPIWESSKPQALHELFKAIFSYIRKSPSVFEKIRLALPTSTSIPEHDTDDDYVYSPTRVTNSVSSVLPVHKQSYQKSTDPLLEQHKISPIAADGDCMFNSVIRGINRLSGFKVPAWAINASMMRQEIVTEIETNMGDYFDQISYQIAQNIRDSEFIGYPAELKKEMHGLSKGYEKTRKTGLGMDGSEREIIRFSQRVVDKYIEALKRGDLWGGAIEVGIVARLLKIKISIHRRGGTIYCINSEEIGLQQISLDYTGKHYNLILSSANNLSSGVKKGSEHSPSKDCCYPSQNFFTYYTCGMNQILNIRLRDSGLSSRDVVAVRPVYYDDNRNNIVQYFQRIVKQLQHTRAVVAPVNLHDRHWTGLVAEKSAKAQLIFTYMDPENQPMPKGLEAELRKYSPEGYTIAFRQHQVPSQRYGNCGPEVVENFLAYFTGKRVSQEFAVPLHSSLIERALLQKEDRFPHKSLVILDPRGQTFVPHTLEEQKLYDQLMYADRTGEIFEGAAQAFKEGYRVLTRQEDSVTAGSIYVLPLQGLDLPPDEKESAQIKYFFNTGIAFQQVPSFLRNLRTVSSF